MPRLQRTDSGSIQTSGGQPLAISPDDGVKVTAVLTADPGSFVRTSTASFSQIDREARTNQTRVSQKLPTVDGDSVQYKRFRTICDDVLREVRRLKPVTGQTSLLDDWMTAAAEIEALVQDLYDVAWGEKDALKRVVLKVEGQINNAVWDRRHVGFLEDVFVALRYRYSINVTTVDEVADLVKSHELPLFRGTLSTDNLRKRFNLVEVESQEPTE